ncbi:MAG: hypothetical protein HKN23_21540, partial [Verrucomicrobiales bacterium]|nr:hypothetical protein [Verrucomicrobiales bacterium]
ADGRIYSGNHNERETTGGSLGWFDPKTREFGGINFPHDDCEFLTTANGGRWIVYASDFTFVPSKPEVKPRDGCLIVFNTETQKVERQFSPLSDGSAGVVMESGTTPGILIGIGKHEKVPMLYVANVKTGEVEKRVPLPGPAPRHIARGPDNRIYFFVKSDLVRTDPATLEFETICPAEPGPMAFLGTDLYIAGTPELRRVAGVAGRD